MDIIRRLVPEYVSALERAGSRMHSVLEKMYSLPFTDIIMEVSSHMGTDRNTSILSLLCVHLFSIITDKQDYTVEIRLFGCSHYLKESNIYI